MRFMAERYQYNEIPKKFDVIIYTHYCHHSDYNWNIGTITHHTSDMSGDNYICIAQTKVSVLVPKQKVDIKQMVLDALEAEKKKQLAEHYKRMTGLQEKIDSLLCLNYTPSKPTIDEAANDIPF